MRVAFIFPGQGSQYAGMGKELINYTEYSHIFQKAKDILGYDILNIMVNGTENELKETAITQPAVFLFSACLIEKYTSYMIKHEKATAGHSLGELTALYYAGALSLEDALFLVRERALGFSEASRQNPSTMAAVFTSTFHIVEEVCRNVSQNGEIVVPANYNSPSQLVISGSTEGVKRALEELNKKGVKSVMLKVGGAFHSPLMEPAIKRFLPAVERVTLKNPRIPVYSNVDAKPHSNPSVIKENLIKQITSPVLWWQTIINMKNDGVEAFCEVGPGSVLKNIIKKFLPEVPVIELSDLVNVKV